MVYYGIVRSTMVKSIILSGLIKLSFLFLGLCLISCFSPLDFNDSLVTFYLGSSETANPARAGAWPPDNYNIQDDLSYTITLTGNGSPITASSRGGTSVTVRARPGSYAVTIDCFYDGLLYAQGTMDIEVSSGASNSFPVEMKSPENTFLVVCADSWDAAVTAIRTGGNDRTYDINIARDIDDMPGIGNDFGSAGNITVNIRGNKTISLIGTGSLLSIGNNQTVNIYDTKFQGNNQNNTALIMASGGDLFMNGNSSIQNNIILVPSGGGDGAGVFIQANGSLTMRDNASIHSNTAYNAGGGVYGGIVTMSGNASVYGNTANHLGGGNGGGGVFVSSNGRLEMSDNAKIYYNKAVYNPIAVSGGGGVSVENGGNFTMSGNASIYENIAGDSISNNGVGGGVYNGGTFIMNGGTIYENTAYQGGGGVFVSPNGNFEMSGNARVYSNISNAEGGGVYVSGLSANNSYFTMSGNASVDYNIAENSGGGVYLATDSTFNMDGGRISYNTAQDGGGVYIGMIGIFIMSAGSITENTALNNGGGVYLLSSILFSGQFHKSGGRIYGLPVINGLNVARSGEGHAVYRYMDSPFISQFKNSTSFESDIVNIIGFADDTSGFFDN